MTYSNISALRKLFMSELFNIKFEYTKHAKNRKRLCGNYIESFVPDSVRLKLTGFKIPLLRN